jgi:hypothetical protein
MSETPEVAKTEHEPPGEATAEPEAPASVAAPSGAAAGPTPGRLQQLIVEYGVIGIIVLLSLSGLTYVGFAVAFLVGFQVDGAGETAGVLGAAAVGWALTKPIRIPLAIALTPVVAAIWHRVRGKAPKPTAQ